MTHLVDSGMLLGIRAMPILSSSRTRGVKHVKEPISPRHYCVGHHACPHCGKLTSSGTESCYLDPRQAHNSRLGWRVVLTVLVAPGQELQVIDVVVVIA